MDTKINRHYKWIDFARFAGLFLVVFFHCPPALSGLSKFMLSSLHLPSLFFISGLLFQFERHPSFLQFIKHRSKQLILPYFCFFVLFYLFWLLAGRKMDGTSVPFYEPIFEYVYGRPKLVCMPLWFLPCLFLIQCLYYLFQRLPKIVAVLLLFAAPSLPVFFDVSNTPWMLDGALTALPFYGIASLFRTEILLFFEQKGRYFWSFVALLLFWGIVIWGFKKIQYLYFESLLHPIAGFLLIIPFFVVVKTISDNIKKRWFIDYISTNTIIVLAFHTYVIRAIQIFVFNILNYQSIFFDEKYLLKFLMAVLVTITMFVPIFIINKYAPFILGKRNSE